MSFIGLRVPHETARLLSELEVPGQKDSTDKYHVTLIHLGDDVPIERLATAMVAIFKVSSQTQPFTVSTQHISCFPRKGTDADVPIICRIDSAAIHSLHKALKKSLQDAGVEFEDRFPEYKPHVTISWSTESIVDKAIPMVEWGAHELVMWGGDQGNRRITVTFPFSLKLKQARKVLARFVGKSLSGESPP